LASLTFGNLGISEAKCEIQSVDDLATLYCEEGALSEIVEFGITTDEEEQ
jgi:hypothetical protein